MSREEITDSQIINSTASEDDGYNTTRKIKSVFGPEQYSEDE